MRGNELGPVCVYSEDLYQDWSERRESDQMLLQRIKERNNLPIAAMKAGSCTNYSYL